MIEAHLPRPVSGGIAGNEQGGLPGPVRETGKPRGRAWRCARRAAAGVLLGLLAATVAEGAQESRSNVFPLDTRDVADSTQAVSPGFVLDIRFLDGVRTWAVSGDAALDTGGDHGVPRVLGIVPDVVPGSDVRQWISLRGSGFVEGAAVLLRVGDAPYTIPPERTQFVSAGEIRVFVNVTSAAAAWTAQVVNPGGPASTWYGFQVGAPAVSPDPGMDFGTTPPGTPVSRTFTVRNNGAATAAVSVAVASPFELIGAPPADLPAGGTTGVTVRYNPGAPGSHVRTATFQIGGESVARTLSGRSGAAAASTGSVAGFVQGADGAGGYVGLKGAKVSLNVATSMSEGLVRSSGFATHSRSDGGFALEGVPPGHYLIAVAPQGNDAARYYEVGYGGDPITVTAGAVTDFTAQLNILPTDPANPLNQPVVLVRGLGAAGENEDGYWSAMRDHLRAEGFTNVWIPNTAARSDEPDSPVVNGERGVTDNARALEAWLHDEVADYRADNAGVAPKAIRFVCHSMGGLIVRQLLSDAKGLPPVSDVVMLSTPNAGSLLADLKAPIAPWFEDWQSISQLTTRYVRNDFKAKWPAGDNLRLFAAGGTSASNFILRAGSVLLTLTSPRGDRANDGAVTLLSSRGEYIVGDYSQAAGIFALLHRPTIRQAFADARFAAREAVALDHSTITSDPAMRKWVARILTGETPAGIGPVGPEVLAGPPRNGPAEPGVIEPTPLESPGDEPLPEQLLEALQGELAAGASANHTVPVDPTARAVFQTTLSRSAVGFSLLSPSGLPVTEPGPGVTVEEVLDGETRIVAIALKQPEPGVWTARLDGSASSEPAAYSLRVTGESNRALVGGADQRYGPGDAAKLLAGLGDVASGEPIVVGGLVVQAESLAPSGAVAALGLADNGLEADGEPGDGLYGGSIVPVPEPGWHRLLFRADGVDPASGEPFRRVFEGQLCVGSDDGFISGEPTSKRIDADDNGYADFVQVEVPVTVAAPGSYMLAGKLVDAEGTTEIAASTAFVREGGGTANVTLVFSPRDLPEGRAFGPFDLAGLELFRQEDASEWLDRYGGELKVYATLFNEYSKQLRIEGDLAFGSVPIYQSAAREVVLHNDGWETVRVDNIALPAGFAGSFAGAIEPGASRTFQIVFQPVAEADYGGELIATSDAVAGEWVRALSGHGGPVELIPIEAWLSARGVPPERAGIGDDPNQDGVPNGLAYLFNLHPMQVGVRGAAWPRADFVTGPEGVGLVLTYRRNRNLVGVAVEFQMSDSLEEGSWQTVAPVEHIEVGTDPSTNDPIMRATLPSQPGGRSFGRIRAVFP